MEEIPKNPILEFNPNQLENVRRVFNYEDIQKLQQDIDHLDEWIRKQNHFLVKDYDKKYLERYLICCKGSIERAKKHLDKMCTLRGLMPDYLQNYDVRNEFTELRKTLLTAVLPKPTTDNYRLFMTQVYNTDSEETFSLLHFTRYFTLIQEYFYHHDYNVGLEIIVDTRNYTYNIISKFYPTIVSNIVMLMIEARGLRLKRLHVIVGSKFFDIILTIFKQGLTKKLKSRLHAHESLESLYEFVPKELLPKDLGGDQVTLQELSDRTFKEISSDDFLEKVKIMETAVTDESKRMSSEFNEVYSGMPGSFKVLSVD